MQEKLIVVDDYDGEYLMKEEYRPIAEKLKEEFPDDFNWVPIYNVLFIEHRKVEANQGSSDNLVRVGEIPARWREIIYQISGRRFYYALEMPKTNASHKTQISSLLYHGMCQIQLASMPKTSSCAGRDIGEKI